MFECLFSSWWKGLAVVMLEEAWPCWRGCGLAGGGVALLEGVCQWGGL